LEVISLFSALGIIGGGVMAEAILSRLLSVGTYQAAQIIVSDPLWERRNFLQQQYGVAVTDRNQEVVQAQTVLLAIKPQSLDQAIAGLVVPPESLIVSILAGVTLSRLETIFTQQPVVRTMPNTPATVGAGITAIAGGQRVQAAHYEKAIEMFQAVGKVVRVAEAQLDAVTGLSGSGPAYVAILIEALADGGVAAGLARPIAQQLALQTVLGTAQLMDTQNLHPALCKDQVTSPGGTTIAGVAALERGGFRSTLIEAVLAATRRSQELSGS
jgi:pyrroline-5-carboxylate reductase